MKISINANLENLKEDFFRGMSKSETLSLVLLLVINLTGVMVSLFILDIPVIIAIYLLLPIDILIGVIGFFPAKKFGKSFPEFVRLMWKVKFAPTLRYTSTEFDVTDDIRYEEPESFIEVEQRMLKMVGTECIRYDCKEGRIEEDRDVKI